MPGRQFATCLLGGAELFRYRNSFGTETVPVPGQLRQSFGTETVSVPSPPVNRKLPFSLETPRFPKDLRKVSYSHLVPSWCTSVETHLFLRVPEKFPIHTPGFLLFPFVSNGALQWKLQCFPDLLGKFPIHTQILGFVLHWKLSRFSRNPRKVSYTQFPIHGGGVGGSQILILGSIKI